MSNHDRSNHDRRIMSENPGVYIAMKSAVNMFRMWGYPFVDSCCGVKVTIKARSILTSYHGLTKQICLPKQTGKQQDPLSEKEPSLCSTMID